MKSHPKSDEKSQIDIKTILKALGSRLRTEILAQLATGDKYVLQLVRTLNKTQQDIHRNLNYLEQLGLVQSYTLGYEDYRKPHTKPSKGRRYFSIDHSFMLQINLAPNLFNLNFQSIPLEHVRLEKRNESKDESLKSVNIQKKNLTELSDELLEQNNKLKSLEKQQYAIFIKQCLIQNQIVDLINQFAFSPLQLVVLTRIIGVLPKKTEDLAEDLNLNPNQIQSILESLKEFVPIKNDNDHWSL
jgi:predicted transcriptional regulator